MRRGEAISSATALLVVALGYVGCGAVSADAPLQSDQPDVEQIVARARDTAERLKRDTVEWTTVFETPNPDAAIHVKVTRSPTMRSMIVAYEQGTSAEELIRIVERDNAWFVVAASEVAKYRPYEAPLPLPALYEYMTRSELRTLVEGAFPANAQFESLDGKVATYRVPLADSAKLMLQQMVDSYESAKERDPNLSNPQLEQQLPAMRDALEHGTAMAIDVATGTIAMAGGLGKRFWVKDLRWLEAGDHTAFDVDASKAADHTGLIFDENTPPDELLLIGHAGAWRPGGPPLDSDTLLINLKSRHLRRIPFPLGVTGTRCFSKDRRSVFATGQVPDEGTIGLFHVDLATGRIRRLGTNLFTGFVLFPALSPDGKTLAVTHKSGAESNSLESQVCLVDVASGKARPLGEPLDTAFLSWMPDNSGVVLVLRKYMDLSKPSVDTIASMDLSGRITKIRWGTSPVVLAPYRRILYVDQQDDLWKVCNFAGRELTVIGDGLQDFRFPSPSPEGRRAIMMRSDQATGPRPYLVDLASGTATPITVDEGLWLFPAWR